MASTKLVSLLHIEWATDIHGFSTMYITRGSFMKSVTKVDIFTGKKID